MPTKHTTLFNFSDLLPQVMFEQVMQQLNQMQLKAQQLFFFFFLFFSFFKDSCVDRSG